MTLLLRPQRMRFWKFFLRKNKQVASFLNDMLPKIRFALLDRDEVVMSQFAHLAVFLLSLVFSIFSPPLLVRTVGSIIAVVTSSSFAAMMG
jgi:cytochrome c oxidase subunit IV